MANECNALFVARKLIDHCLTAARKQSINATMVNLSLRTIERFGLEASKKAKMC